MATYKEQLDEVKSYKIREGQTYRGDCPFCYGHNTFGISNSGGELRWGCFKASCDAGGRNNGLGSLQSVKDRLSKLQLDATVRNPIPDLILPVHNRPDVIEYLKSVNSYEAYTSGLVDIKYSPVEDRVMFPVKVGDTIEGYSGRALTYPFPKWKKYGIVTSLFSCGRGPIGVLVEDAPSACAVGIIPDYTGLALLGTQLITQHKLQLMKFKTVLIALDPDASGKAIELSRRIPNSRVVLIPNDLKYYKYLGVKEILNGEVNT